jgi:hemolysin-activating ACP:hemolysin acyltransferase
MPPRVTALRDPMVALGVAAHFLGSRAPFRDFPAGELIATLAGQAKRGHALFALEGQRVRAYVGWALFTTAEAEALARTGIPPAPPAGQQGDVVWMLTIAAADAAAMKVCFAELRRRYAGKRVMGVRHRPDGKRIPFDVATRPVSPARAASG